MRRNLIGLALMAGLIAACSGSAATGAPQTGGSPADGTPQGATQAVPPPAGPMTALQKISHGIDNLQEDGSVS